MTTVSLAKCRPSLSSRYLSPSPTKGLGRTKVAKIGGLAAGNRCRSGDCSVDNIIGLPLLHTEPSCLKVPYTTPREPEYLTPRTSTTHYYQHTADDPSYIDDMKEESGRPLSVVGERLDTASNASFRLSSVPLPCRRQQYYISTSSSSCSDCSNCGGRTSPDNPPPSPEKIPSNLKLDGIKMSYPDKRTKFETRDFTPGLIKKREFCCGKCEFRMASHDCLQLDNGSPLFSYYRHYSANHPGAQTYGRIPPLLKDIENIQQEELKNNCHKGDIFSLPNLPYTTSEKLMSDAVIERLQEKPPRKLLPKSIARRIHRRETPDHNKEEIVFSTCISSKKMSHEIDTSFEEATQISEQLNNTWYVDIDDPSRTPIPNIDSLNGTFDEAAEYNIDEAVNKIEPMWTKFWPVNGCIETPSPGAESPELNQNTSFKEATQISEQSNNTLYVDIDDPSRTPIPNIDSPNGTFDQVDEYSIDEAVNKIEPMWTKFWPLNGCIETPSPGAESPELIQDTYFKEATQISEQSNNTWYVDIDDPSRTPIPNIDSPNGTFDQVDEYSIDEAVNKIEPMRTKFWPLNGCIETPSPGAESPELSQSNFMQQTLEKTENDINTQQDSYDDMLVENQCIVPSISVSFRNLPRMSTSKEKQEDVQLYEEIIQEADEQTTAKQQFNKSQFFSRDKNIENRELLQDIIRECAQGLREISHRGFLPDISTRSDFVYKPNTDKRYNRWKRRKKKKSKQNRDNKQYEISSPDESSAEEAENGDETERPESQPRFRRRRRETIEKLFGSEQAMMCYDASSELTSSDRDNYASLGNCFRRDDRGSKSYEDLDARATNMLQNGKFPVLKMINGNMPVYSEQHTFSNKDNYGLIKHNQKSTNSSFKWNDSRCVEVPTPVPLNTDTLRPSKYESTDKINADELIQHDSNDKDSRNTRIHSNIASDHAIYEHNDFHAINTGIGLGSYSEPGLIKCGSYVKQNILTNGNNSVGSSHNVLSSMESFTGNTIDIDRGNLAALDIHTFNSSQTDFDDLQDNKISCSVTQSSKERKDSGKDESYYRLEKSLLQLAKQHLQTNQSVSNKKYSDGQLKSKLPNISDSKLTMAQKRNGKQSKNYRNVLNRFVEPLNIDNLNRSKSPYVKDNNTALVNTLRRQRKENMVIKNDKVKREKRIKQQLLSRRVTETTSNAMQENKIVNSDLSSLTLNHLLQTMPGNKSEVNIKTKKVQSAEPNNENSQPEQKEQQLPVLDIQKLNMLAKSYVTSESDIDKRSCVALKNASKTSLYSYSEDQHKQKYSERSLSTLSFSRAFTFSVFELPISYKEKNKQIERRASTAWNCRA